jgi:formate dehydrogenase iron-sulfur subunit
MYGLLFDANLCVGCGSCMEACKEKNELPKSDGRVLSASDYTVVEERGNDLYLRRMCMHCLEPSCVSACPVGALQKRSKGPVVYDFKRCIGCRYCMVACPFEIPRYEWASVTPRVRKCQFCPERVNEGRPTACAQICPTEATVFGKRTDLIALAWKRIAGDPEHYAPTVYGGEEAGGTSVLLIGPTSIMSALNRGVPKEPIPTKTWVVLSQIPTAVGVAGAALLGVNWIIRRRIALAAGEKPCDEDQEPSRSGRNTEGESQ